MKDYPLSAATEDIRPLLSAGHFFPREKEELSARLAETAAGAHPGKPVKGRAALVPQGALNYSGSGLLWALQQLPLSSARAIVIMAKVHRENEETIWFPDYSGFHTPFGILPVDRDTLDSISETGNIFRLGRIPFEEEPCFDLILSALASFNYTAPVLPVLFGSATDSLLQSGLYMLEELLPEYLPLVSANFVKKPESGMIQAQGEDFLLKLLETHFHAPPDRWYHGESPQYCAALWQASQSKSPEKAE
jgi:AmmeMemoRadiSam system protein B